MNIARPSLVGSGMKLATLLACLLLSPAFAEDTKPDLLAPKPADLRSIRVLLHLPGSARIIDYPDVCKVVSCTADCIIFETFDGTAITHRGSFTVIQPRNVVSEPVRQRLDPGPRFYETK